MNVSSWQESSARGWTLPSLDEVKAEGLKLAASGFTTVQTPHLCESSKQAVLQQRRVSCFSCFPQPSLPFCSPNVLSALVAAEALTGVIQGCNVDVTASRKPDRNSYLTAGTY